MAYRLAELAELVGGQVEGDPERIVEAIRALDAAGPRDLSFLIHSRYGTLAAASAAGALLVGREARETPGLSRDLLVADDPSLALARLIAAFHPPPLHPPGVDPTAVVEPGARIDPSAHVGPYAVIGEGSRIGARAAVLALAVVGRDCNIGEEAVLHPHAVLYDGTELGPRSRVHAGAVIGADGFGYASERGAHRKIPQVGRVVVEADVEIGANTTIDRATLGETRIGEGTKIDNLVQVGHNTWIGKHCILCGQVGIAGSARLGEHVVLGGQTGVGDHVEIGDRVQAGGRTGFRQSVEPGATVSGDPAVDLRSWRRQVVLLGHLEEMNRRLRALERKLEGRKEV